MTVGEIYEILCQAAPLSLAESWDNAGFLVGRRQQQADKVLCALDVTETVVREAESLGAQLIVSHHPVIFHPLTDLTDGTPTGRVVRLLVEKDISAICMHTNLDSAQGGVNDCLAAALGLTDVENMGAGESAMLGRVGNLPQELALTDFVRQVKQALGAGGVRYCDGARPVRRVAVGGGACGKLMDEALAKGADSFVIGDCSYDVMMSARDKGLNLIDAGHFPTENTVVPYLVRLLQEHGIRAVASENHEDCIHFM